MISFPRKCAQILQRVHVCDAGAFQKIDELSTTNESLIGSARRARAGADSINLAEILACACLCILCAPPQVVTDESRLTGSERRRVS